MNVDAWPYPPITFPLAPERIALLVIDMQYHDASPDRVGRTMTERAPPSQPTTSVASRALSFLRYEHCSTCSAV